MVGRKTARVNARPAAPRCRRGPVVV